VPGSNSVSRTRRTDFSCPCPTLTVAGNSDTCLDDNQPQLAGPESRAWSFYRSVSFRRRRSSGRFTNRSMRVDGKDSTMTETEIYDRHVAKEKLHTEVHTNVSSPGEGELVAVVRGKLDNRTLDHKIRIRENTLEEAYNYFDNGELFESGQWREVPNHHLSDDGKRVISGQTPSDHGESTIEEWLHGTPVPNMIDDLTELWVDAKEESIRPD